MRALVCEAVGQALKVKSISTPKATPGSVIIKVLAAVSDPNTPHHLKGETSFTFPLPFTPGGRSIGRVAEVGPDTTSLGVGQLVLLEPFLRARDNPNVQALWGVFDGPSPRSKKLTADNWAMGSFAEYVKAPLENCHALNEKILCEKLGYSLPQLAYLTTSLIPYGGLRGIKLTAGETVLIAPATGSYSGAAVGVAVAMGAKVIAVGRNLEVLKQLQATFPCIKIAQLKGNVEADAEAIAQHGPVDAYLDVSPPQANETTHIRSCFMTLRPYGRVSLMGINMKDIAIPYVTAMFMNLTIRGQYMYEKEDVRGVIKLAESGVLKLNAEGGVKVVGEYKLEDVENSFEAAEANAGPGKIVVLTPHSS